jgi:hypothetical protein
MKTLRITAWLTEGKRRGREGGMHSADQPISRGSRTPHFPTFFSVQMQIPLVPAGGFLNRKIHPLLIVLWFCAIGLAQS